MNKVVSIVGMVVFFFAAGLTTPSFAIENGIIYSPENGNISLQNPTIIASSVITPNGDWYQFGFTTVGVDATGCVPADPAGLLCGASSGTPTTFAPAPAWTFDCPTSGCWLTVTDAFQYGDEFEIFDNAVILATTSSIGTGSCGDDPEVCLVDPNPSHVIIDLDEGSHSITIKPTISPFNSGAAYFKVEIHDAPVAGQLLAVDRITLAIGGFASSAVWMIPAVVSIAGTCLYLGKYRAFKN